MVIAMATVKTHRKKPIRNRMNNMKLCDLHTHLLPGVDDGAPTTEYALNMLRNAVASDVVFLAVTPHCNTPYGNGNYLSVDLLDRFLKLQQAAKDIPIELVLGAEARINKDLPAYLQQGLIPTINKSRYLLTEFSPDAEDFTTALQQIIKLGYTPLIAHPERYSAVCKTPQIVVQWLDMGCHLQLTGGSLVGQYGKTVQRTAAFLLKNDLIACIASDAHGTDFRSNFLLDVYDHLTVRYSKQYAQCLLYENPMRICGNHDL